MPNEAMPEMADVAPEPKKGGVLGLIIAILALVAAIAAIVTNVVMKPDTSALEARIQTVETKADSTVATMPQNGAEDAMEEQDDEAFDTMYAFLYEGNNMTISYPQSWHAKKYDNVLFLTSHRGGLVSAASSGGPLMEGEYFSNGIQIRIERKMTGDERYIDAMFEETGTEGLRRVADPCDGAGCPNAEYLFDGFYIIQVNYSDESYNRLQIKF